MTEQGPGPTGGADHLDRHPAIDYGLDAKGEQWFLKALQAATPGLTFILQRFQRGWLRTDLLAGLAVAAYLVPHGDGLLGDRRRATRGRPLDRLGRHAGVRRDGWLPGPLGRPGVDHRPAHRPGHRPDGRRRPGKLATLAAALSLIIGFWCLVGRVLRLGVVADLLSQPLLVGYLAGAAVLMVVGQLGKVTGTTVQGETLVDQMISFTRGLNGTHLATLWVALGTLALILLIHFLLPKWPAALIGVAAATVAYGVFDWGRLGVKAVGAVPDGIPVPSIPVLSVGELKALLVVGRRRGSHGLQRQHAHCARLPGARTAR
jgi:Sulfate permease and related transporters (MFS superfamily)